MRGCERGPMREGAYGHECALAGALRSDLADALETATSPHDLLLAAAAAVQEVNK
jgi:hypothetical protein